MPNSDSHLPDNHNQQPLAGEVALISGGGTGIGAALAMSLAEYGCEVVITGRREAPLHQTASNISNAYPDCKIHVMTGDIRQPDTCQQWVETTLALCGRLDIVVNNAGVCGKLALSQEVPPDDIDAMVDINLKGAMYLTQQALALAFVPNQQGTLVNINSIAGKQPFPYWAAYSASKAGFAAYAKAVQDEHRHNNVRVINLYPAAVKTPLWEPIDLTYVPDDEDMLTAEEVANAALLAICQQPGTVISDITLSALQPSR